MTPTGRGQPRKKNGKTKSKRMPSYLKLVVHNGRSSLYPFI